MSTKDISRFLFQPRKRYSGVRMQQGRVILDADWNESERIDDEEARRTLVDVICAKGTSNQGFLVGQPTDAEVTLPSGDSVPTYDFPFHNGSFYLGGLRFESQTEGDPETFLRQDDWLQIDASSDTLPSRPVNLTPVKVRHDLVYLRGWEQCVSAVEDSELLERALGTDASVRNRRMRRVEVLTNVPETCAEAFDALKQALTAPIPPDPGGPHEFDDENFELKSKARLTVVPDPAGITDDPCKPAVPGGYLGADNQTIRVQLTATNRFIWGFDNAAPLYRVQVEDSVGGPRRKIKFLTLPRDQAAQALKGQAVELIPWGALLPNQEKIAELQGRFFTVETSYDPEDDSLTITQEVPQQWIDWLAGHNQFWSDRDPADKQQYFYLRLLTGGSGDAADPTHAFTPGVEVPLGQTGLKVKFSHHGLPGDFWIIAARPNTPNLVVPWELLDEAPPFGPRYFFAPLALIRWQKVGEQPPVPSVQDCRKTFRPLCDINGCCTITVGNGVSSHGDFETIEEAVDHLPPTGGEVCLLPGLHEANVRIVRRRNITIKGCDKQTTVIPRPSNREAPIFHVIDSQCITLVHMDLVTLAGTAVVLEATEDDALKEIAVHHNRVLACRRAIEVHRGAEINIHDNRIRMFDKEGAGVAIFVRAEDSLIERNDIGVVPAERIPPTDVPGDDVPDPTDPCEDPERIYANVTFLVAFANRVFGILVTIFPVAPFKALGGVQIGAGSERVRVLENSINGGAGNGITLGGALAAPTPGPDQDGDETAHVIEHTGAQIWGDVTGPSGSLAGIGLLFRRTDGTGTPLPAATDSAGQFLVDADPGEYSVSITSPGHRIESITTEDRGEFGVFHRIRVEDEEIELEDLLAFLYEIQIDRNHVQHMGLSGIGIPRVTERESSAALSQKRSALDALRALLGNPIVALSIHRNHIHDCLQNPFDDQLRAQARRRGLGGVSLGLCENLTISGNRIERNGINHINPVCGIFITFGEKVNIHDNLISENGPLDPIVNLDLQRGRRGGIVLIVASFGIEDLIVNPDREFDTGRHAARIHDNIVHQPAGQALQMFAIGPVSVCNNRFHTVLSGPETLERLAGALLILNAGSGQALPAGSTLFNSNQSRLGSESDSITSQIIWTVDDLGFDANQSDGLGKGLALTDTISFFVNTFLLGATLRASDSRFKETPGLTELSFRISLLSLSSLLNNTNNNHGDHCIFAINTTVGRPADDTGNQFLDSTLCSELNVSIATPAARFAVVAPIRG